jgi:hypothetical protein
METSTVLASGRLHTIHDQYLVPSSCPDRKQIVLPRMDRMTYTSAAVILLMGPESG